MSTPSSFPGPGRKPNFTPPSSNSNAQNPALSGLQDFTAMGLALSGSKPGTPSYGLAANATPMSEEQWVSTARNSVHPHDATSFGVGLAIESPSMKVDDLIPGCSAEKSGSVMLGDEVLAVDGTEVQHAHHAKDLILGRQGTYATITFRRIEGPNLRTFRVQLMRGSADYIFLVECLRSLEMQNAKLTEENQELRMIVPGEKGGESSSQTKMLEKKISELYVENEQLRQRERQEQKRSAELQEQLSHVAGKHEDALKTAQGHANQVADQDAMRRELEQRTNELKLCKDELDDLKKKTNEGLNRVKEELDDRDMQLEQKSLQLSEAQLELEKLRNDLEEVGRSKIEDEEAVMMRKKVGGPDRQRAAPPPPGDGPLRAALPPSANQPLKAAPPPPPEEKRDLPVMQQKPPEQEQEPEPGETETNFEETRNYKPINPGMPISMPELSPPMGVYPPMGMGVLPSPVSMMPYDNSYPMMSGGSFRASPGSFRIAGTPVLASPPLHGSFRSVPVTLSPPLDGSFRGRSIV